MRAAAGFLAKSLSHQLTTLRFTPGAWFKGAFALSIPFMRSGDDPPPTALVMDVVVTLRALPFLQGHSFDACMSHSNLGTK